MLFNSFEFAIFLPVVFLLYWFVVNRNLRVQNLFVVGVSYLFYGWWDWRFLVLIALTTGASFASGVWIERTEGRARKAVAVGNVVLNLLILCVFKYLNFFGENLSRLFQLFGFEADWVTIRILLPVGISFYTFQALSYTIDVYKGKIAATRDAAAFFAYVSFFPQLVAGPIERATNLLPQFYKKRTFDYARAVDGMRQILWGLFKKIVVADNCSTAVNEIFGRWDGQGSLGLVIGAVLFAFQIYGDFSGYSDIAIGTARLFGIDLMRNFNFPYFSRDIAEFWRRWHISLSTWFRDYIYIPMGGSRGSKWQSFRNTMVLFLVSGFWHGANWTFVAWGAYHALLFAPLLIAGKNRKFTDTPTWRQLPRIVLTFALVTVGWVLFRADTIGDAWGYISRIFTAGEWGSFTVTAKKPAVCILILVMAEWFARRNQHALEHIPIRWRWLRWALYVFIAYFTITFGASQQDFIYFQF